MTVHRTFKDKGMPDNTIAPKKMGRPSKYSDHLAQVICLRIAEGESLNKICKDDEMPERVTIYRWLLEKEDFCNNYARAREDQAETHADEIVSIADETPELVPVFDKDGNQIDVKLDSAYIQWQRQRIDARKWNAAKQRPRKYGERITHSGDDTSPVVVENNMNVFGELLKAIKMQRQAE